MIAVNEISRRRIKVKGYHIMNVTALNSNIQLTNLCSWNCYNNTNYCKLNHVKYFKPYFKVIDPIYFGIIKALKNTGNYQLANIIFLVIIWPLFMLTILIKSLNIYKKIKLLNA